MTTKQWDDDVTDIIAVRATFIICCVVVLSREEAYYNSRLYIITILSIPRFEMSTKNIQSALHSRLNCDSLSDSTSELVFNFRIDLLQGDDSLARLLDTAVSIAQAVQFVQKRQNQEAQNRKGLFIRVRHKQVGYVRH